MSLASNRNAKTTQTVVLFKMGAVPTTEDLKYVLAEAVKARKPVELPFKHPDTGMDFAIRVTAGSATTPSRWTFSRAQSGGSQVLWTKDTNEVPVIQSKIRVDSTQRDSQGPSSAPSAFHL